MTPLLTVNLLRALFVTFCATIGASVSAAIENSAWPGLVLGIVLGLVVVLIDRLLKGFSLRAFSSATFGLLLGMLFANLLSASDILHYQSETTQWVARLSEAKRQGTLEAELKRLSFVPLLVVDEVGYIPFDPEAASLMFSLVSNRYERASMIVTSNKPFSKWGEIFGDDMAATAMIDRLIHHSEILSLKGDSYRLRGKDLDARPTRPADLG